MEYEQIAEYRGLHLHKEIDMSYTKPDWLFVVNFTDYTKSPPDEKSGKMKVEKNELILEGMTPDEFERYWMLSLEKRMEVVSVEQPIDPLAYKPYNLVLGE